MPPKGQTLSKEAVDRMNKSKHATLSSKYNWDIVEEFLDNEIGLSSRNKKNSYITLRQFKSMIETGLDIKKINELTSKTLTGFFSALCQGKITLTKEKFMTEYEKGKSLEEIAKENKICFDYIGYLRQMYGFRAKGAKFINRKNTEVPLTQRQKEIIYGSLLGDAKKMALSSVAFKQSTKQEEYLKWKFEETKSIMSSNSLKKTSDIDKRTGKASECWRCYSYANTDVENINKQFYGNGSKEVTNEILSNLTPLSLAVWYMDDGNTGWSVKSREKHPDWDYSPEMKLCTDSYSRESCENIVNWFKNKWNIDCHLRERGIRKGDGGMMYRVIFDSSSVWKFIDLISIHVLPSMKYKVDYEAYLKWREEKKIANEKNYFDEWWQEGEEDDDTLDEK